MVKKAILLSVLTICATSLFSQITREQADAIVLEHIQREVVLPYLLYVNVNTPNAAGITLTTHNEENMKVKYACWAYYLNENPEINEPSQHRYLFVKENDGNLLEVITYNDLGPADLTQWMLVSLIVNEKDKNDIQVYPNPTTRKLTIDNGQLTIKNVEIYDVYGRKVHESSLTVLQSYDFTVFPAGIYFLKITTETGSITKKIIKN